MLVAGLVTSVVMPCFAEVSSYFTAAGGPYLYSLAAFGRLIGLQTGMSNFRNLLCETRLNHFYTTSYFSTCSRMIGRTEGATVTSS
jgi:amino acid transporter